MYKSLVFFVIWFVVKSIDGLPLQAADLKTSDGNESAHSQLMAALDSRTSLVNGVCEISGTIRTHLDKEPRNINVEYSFDFLRETFCSAHAKGILLCTPEYYFRTHSRDHSDFVYRKSATELPDRDTFCFDIRGLGLLNDPTVAATLQIVRFPLLIERYSSAKDVVVIERGAEQEFQFLDVVEGGTATPLCHLFYNPEKKVIRRFVVDYPGKDGETLEESEMTYEQIGTVFVLSSFSQRNGRLLPLLELDWKFRWSSVNSGIDSKQLSVNRLVGDGKQASLVELPKELDRPVEVGVISNIPPRPAEKLPSKISWSRIFFSVGVILMLTSTIVILWKRRA